MEESLYGSIKKSFEDMIKECIELKKEKQDRYEIYREQVRLHLKTISKHREDFIDEWEEKTKEFRLNQISKRPFIFEREDSTETLMEDSDDETKERAEENLKAFLVKRDIVLKDFRNFGFESRAKTVVQIARLYQRLGVNDAIDETIFNEYSKSDHLRKIYD
jgi:hypothetical protein